MSGFTDKQIGGIAVVHVSGGSQNEATEVNALLYRFM